MTNSAPEYDVIVAGLGIMGAATLAHLARSGARVLGIDQFAPPHAHGSSHGETRLLRVAYAEGERYVPMMRRSVALWRGLEARTGGRLFMQSGAFYAAPPGSALMADVRRSAHTHALSLVEAGARVEEQAARFELPAGWESLVEPDAGYLDAEASVLAFLGEARTHGAALSTGTQLRGVERQGTGALVRTSAGDFSADRVLLCLGAWAARHMPFLERILRLERHVLHWYEDPAGRHDAARGAMPFVIAPRDNCFLYGFPASGSGVKLADHYSGMALLAPEDLSADIPQAEYRHIDGVVRAHLPSLGARARSVPCIYDLSPDEHFILDAHPDVPGVFFFTGSSGHGFKFAPVIGEALANCALGRAQEIDTGFFSLARFMR